MTQFPGVCMISRQRRHCAGLIYLTEALRVADVSSDPSIISFTSGNKLYKGQLSQAGAFIGAWDRGISSGDSPVKVRDLIFADKLDVSFLNRSLTRPGAELKVTFVVNESSGLGVGNRKRYGTMSPDSLRRFEAWKNGLMRPKPRDRHDARRGEDTTARSAPPSVVLPFVRGSRHINCRCVLRCTRHLVRA